MSTQNVETRKSVCPLDCPDTCSLDVKVAGGRVVELDGNHDNPLTAGFICGKVRHFPELVYGSDRLLHPAVRSGPKGSGQFRRVTWDEALAVVVERLQSIHRAHGGEAILPLSYGGSNGWLTHGSVDLRLFHRLGASRLARTVCAMATGAAATGLYGRMPGVAYEDYPLARLIVVWGCNPAVSGIHLMPYLHRAQQSGAKLVVVDPRRTTLARQADLHLAARPGTDLPVALAVINGLFSAGRADLDFLRQHARGWEALRQRAAAWSFERAAGAAGVSAGDLEQFTTLYAQANPAVVRCGWGLEAQSQWRVGGCGGVGAAGRGRQIRGARRRLHDVELGGLGRGPGSRGLRAAAGHTDHQHEPRRSVAGRRFRAAHPRSSSSTATRWPRCLRRTKCVRGWSARTCSPWSTNR